jgi:hypothetical protein
VLVYETPLLVDEPPKPSPVSDPPSVGEPPALRLNPSEPDDPMQC